MTTVTILCGLPGSGKTTFRELIRGGSYVASSDDFIESIAKMNGKTYSEIFTDTIGPATKHFDAMVFHAVSENVDLIVDRTNLTVASRKKVLDRIPIGWKRVAILFECPFEDWKERLMNRPGKLIPREAIDRMVLAMERPSLDEGFHSVLTYVTGRSDRAR